ncbi:MAG: hypothetical protein ACRDNW_01595 [Trebonia sp.]
MLSGRSSWPMMTVSCCAGSASRVRLCQRVGADLLRQLDEVPDRPVIFLADGRVLTSYTQADIAEAVGARVRPKQESYDLVVAAPARPG